MTSLLAAVLVATLALWQAPSSALPEFTGTWTLDSGQSESAVQTEPPSVTTLKITQTSEAIVIETIRAGKPTARTFPIDLTARRDRTAAPSVNPRAYWDGAKLVTEGAVTINGQTVSTREILSLAPNPSELIIERLIVVQHGYSFRGAQNYGTAKDVYKRSRPESD
jgi:hypothetical protein